MTITYTTTIYYTNISHIYLTITKLYQTMISNPHSVFFFPFFETTASSFTPAQPDHDPVSTAFFQEHLRGAHGADRPRGTSFGHVAHLPYADRALGPWFLKSWGSQQPGGDIEFRRYPAWWTFTFCHEKIHHAINGKIHYLTMAMFNCYVSSPEGSATIFFLIKGILLVCIFVKGVFQKQETCWAGDNVDLTATMRFYKIMHIRIYIYICIIILDLNQQICGFHPMTGILLVLTIAVIS